MLADCQGLYALAASVVAGAELPLIQRGARLLGARSLGRDQRGEVAGKRVELVARLCALRHTAEALSEARRLVEQEGADVLDRTVHGRRGACFAGVRKAGARDAFSDGVSIAQR